MKKYVALLRGINVSGQKKIKMVDLKKSLENRGFQNVKTYIQSGNVVFDSDISDVSILEEKMKHAIFEDFGFDVPVLVKTPNELMAILNDSPFTGKAEEKNLYYAVLQLPPAKENFDEFGSMVFENEDFHPTDECVYLNCHKGAGKAKLNNNLIEKKLKVTATTRNHRTMQKLMEMAS